MREDHDRKLDDARRAVYVDYLATCDALVDRVREISGFDKPQDVPADLRTQYQDVWQTMLGRQVSAEMMGPSAVTVAAQELRASAAKLCNPIDEWLRGKRWTQEQNDRFEADFAAHKQVRQAFVTAGQAALKSG